MRIFRYLIAFAVLAVGAAALLACKSGSNGTSAGGASPAATKSGATTSAATQEATSASSNAGSSSGSSDEINALAKKFAASTFHATYKATSSGSDTFANGQMVLIKDGDKRLRFEATVSQGGQDMQVIFIATDAVSAFCLKDAGQLGALLGIEAGKGVCFKSDPNDKNNPVGSISSLFSDLENMDVTVLDKSSRQVAGKDATCYKTRDNKTSDVSTDCFTKDGVLMYSQSEGASGFEMEATDVSGSVSGSDFDLPYEVRDLPASSGG